MHSRLLLLWLAFACGQVEAQDSVTVFPGHRLFPLFTADALAPQLSITRITDTREWIGAIGGSFPLVQASFSDVRMQVGVAATIFNRLIKTPGHITVSTVDYKIDLPVDVRWGSFAGRAGFGHISAHFADDGIEQLGQHSISAVKDYIFLAASYDVVRLGGTVYLSVTDNYHNEPETAKHWMIQAGGTFGEVRVSSWARLYCAVDIKLKEEVEWGSTQSYQAGVRLLETETHAFRIAYTHRRGFEERGQLYDRSVIYNLISLFIDF
jgi:hypothetical protein